MPEKAQEDYQNERVEGAKTLSDSYWHLEKDSEVFIAGVQYALDHLLECMSEYSTGTLLLEHIVATNILKNAKKGEL